MKARYIIDHEEVGARTARAWLRERHGTVRATPWPGYKKTTLRGAKKHLRNREDITLFSEPDESGIMSWLWILRLA